MNPPATHPGSAPDQAPSDPATPQPSRFFIHLALAWTLGTLLGFSAGHAFLWLISASLTVLLSLISIAARRPAFARLAVALTAICIAAAWADIRTQHTSSDTIRRFITPQLQLARVTGLIDDTPAFTPPNHGPFSRFIYRAPSTTFTLQVESITAPSPSGAPIEIPATGKIQISIHEVETRLGAGDRVRVVGWLHPFETPSNPGEFDYAQYMASLDILGRLTLEHQGNLELLKPRADPRFFHDASERLAAAGINSLRLGMPDDPELLAFVDALFIGKRAPDLYGINDSFKRTGLAHILCISGLHFSIFLGLVWFIARLCFDSPRRVSVVVLIFLVTYIVMLPMQVSIIRSGIMAAALCLGALSGRRVPSIQMLGLAAIVVLIWRPLELFSAGAQLSFVGVASLLLLTGPVAAALHAAPPPPLPAEPRPGPAARWKSWLAGRSAEYFAAGLVPSFLSMPIVAYHFSLISPPTVVFSLIMGPIVVVVLSLGYVKMLLGILLPRASVLLAKPLAWACYGFMEYVRTAALLPGAAFDVVPHPSAAWTLAALMTLVALFSGQFRGRPIIGLLCFGLCIAWFIEPHPLDRLDSFIHPQPIPAVTLRALSVGNGACCIVTLPPAPSDPHGRPITYMYDCGTQGYLDVGTRTVQPVLLQFHITRIDALIISHASLKCYLGVLDILDRHAVGRVLLTPYFLDQAKDNPSGPEAVLIDGIKRRNIPIQTVIGPMSLPSNAAQIDLLGPPAGLVDPKPADVSILLSIRAAGHRILLGGGIQEQGIEQFQTAHTDLGADITDLPRHPQISAASTAWLDAVHPSLVIQSAGFDRPNQTTWKQVLDPSRTHLLSTAQSGMIELQLRPDCKATLTYSTFRSPEP